MKNFVKYICLTVAVIVFSLAYMSRTLENLALKKVTLTAPVKGVLDTGPEAVGDVIRVRTPAALVIEDVFVKPGDTVREGDKIMSLYKRAVDRELSAADGEALEFLTEIKDNDYILTAKGNGKIRDVKIDTDGSAAPDNILYKYIPYEAKTVSEVYETIVPLSALTPSGSDGTYVVYLALPLTGRGEAGQYIVSRAKVRLLADDGKSAAIDMVIRDGRQIIISGDEPVKHGEKVRAG